MSLTVNYDSDTNRFDDTFPATFTGLVDRAVYITTIQRINAALLHRAGVRCLWLGWVSLAMLAGGFCLFGVGIWKMTTASLMGTPPFYYFPIAIGIIVGSGIVNQYAVRRRYLLRKAALMDALSVENAQLACHQPPISIRLDETRVTIMGRRRMMTVWHWQLIVEVPQTMPTMMVATMPMSSQPQAYYGQPMQMQGQPQQQAYRIDDPPPQYQQQPHAMGYMSMGQQMQPQYNNYYQLQAQYPSHAQQYASAPPYGQLPVQPYSMPPHQDPEFAPPVKPAI